MLSFFPHFYLDELYYSACARYQSYVWNNCQKDVSEDLFKSRSCCAIVDLPSHLGVFHRQLPTGIITHEELVFKHTLYSYYRPFLPIERANQVYEYLLSKENGGKIHITLGLVASGISSPTYLRYCNWCRIEDEHKYGEPYWHRVHQLPGVYLCPVHFESLIETAIEYSGRRGKHRFVSLANAINFDRQNKPTIPSKFNDKLINLSSLSNHLMQNDYEPIGLDNLRGNYIFHLSRNGYISAAGRIRFSELLSDFVSFHGNEMLSLLESGLDYGNEDTWLHKVLRKPRVSCHPLRHLLILQFMGLDVKDLLIETLQFQPFGNAPWPCLNRAAEHYKQFVVTQCEITRCSKTCKPVGTFICDCGFIYSRRGPDKSADDRFRIGRIKSFGDTWEQKCLEIASEESSSLRFKAKKLGVDPKTFLKFANKSVKKDNELSSHVDNPKSSQGQTGILHSVQNIQKSHIVTVQYTYPSEKKEQKTANRVDWNERDQQTLALVVKAVESILDEQGRPVRITFAEIGRRSGKHVFINYYLDKLSETQNYILQHVETTEQYQLRRIDWAANRLENENELLAVWKIKKLAGISDKCSETVRQCLSSYRL